MWIGWLEFDMLLGDVRSLKQKRSAVRPMVAELRAQIRGVGRRDRSAGPASPRRKSASRWSSADRAHVVDVLDAAERLVAARPELELLSARRGLRRSTDD